MLYRQLQKNILNTYNIISVKKKMLLFEKKEFYNATEEIKVRNIVYWTFFL